MRAVWPVPAFAAVVLGLLSWGLLPAAAGSPAAGVEAVIDLSPPKEGRSSLGIFPPTEPVPEERLRSLGVRRVAPGALPSGLWVETRRAPDGAYITQYGEDLFLTQRSLAARPVPWTLLVPEAAQGKLRVAAFLIRGEPALGIERPGEFSRLEWTEGRFRYIFFDVSGAWGIERLAELARGLE